ncbi:hypothetical protein [Halalkalicoccus salilacus]|uniref:hypothetical protein n=1 Tax=Halalkalicoccus sp. GCM10025704 TaxID=3252662 RepID=UPI0036F27780
MQETIDMIFGEFSYPDSIFIKTEYKSGIKRSEIRISHQSGETIYQLQDNGWDDEAEPELKQISE